MNRISRVASWINRAVLAAATLVFTMIGFRYVASPVSAAAATGAMLNTPLATTTTRVAFGAFPLAIAVFAFTSLLSEHRIVAGVRLVIAVVGSAIVVRAIGAIADGPVPASTRLFIPESVILLLALTGLFLQYKSEQGAQP